jgi:hypothetical protein
LRRCNTVGWEEQGAHRRYTRSKRVNGRVVREYVGVGRRAELIAEFDRLQRERKRQLAAEWQAERRRLAAADEPLANFDDALRDLTKAALLLAGYYQHCRKWRRRDKTMMEKSMVPIEQGGALAVDPSTDPLEQVNKLLPLANEGEPEALAALRAVCEQTPELWRRMGNLASHVEDELVSATAGANEVYRDAIYSSLDEQRRALTGPDPSPLERLLVDRIVVCGLDLANLELGSRQEDERHTPAQREHMARLVDRSHRRYLAAIRTLANVRQMAVPAMQVNVADKQINVS